MVRFFKGRTPTPEQFETQQDKLRRLSGEVLTRYRAEVASEMSDPQRLAITYGSAFATAGFKKQAEVVAKMASGMLSTPNAMVTVVSDVQQEVVASVSAEEITAVPLSESYCKNVIATGRELAVEDSLQHPLVCDTHFAMDGVITSYLGVPVANRDGVIVGVLCVWDKGDPREWGAADVGMLTQLSSILTKAL